MAPSLSELLRGDRVTVAAALNDLEDQRPEARQRANSLIVELRARQATERAHRVGITGPPGVGKSSLISAMARRIRGADPPRTLGVLAVDPSSLVSGGALLGDRIRIATGNDDPGVFVRSLATRGQLGGLARAVPAEVEVLSAAFELVIVETVGVGQSETEVRDVVDALVLVLQPEAGDTLQHLKAGVMELPDILVVNKADASSAARDRAQRTCAELRAALSVLAQAGVATRAPAVVATSALDGIGIAELVEELSRLREEGMRTGDLSRRRRAAYVARGVRAVARRYGEVGLERLGGEEAVRGAFERALDAGGEIDSVVEQLNPFA